MHICVDFHARQSKEYIINTFLWCFHYGVQDIRLQRRSIFESFNRVTCRLFFQVSETPTKTMYQTTDLCEGRRVGDSPNRLWKEHHLSASPESVGTLWDAQRHGLDLSFCANLPRQLLRQCNPGGRGYFLSGPPPPPSFLPFSFIGGRGRGAWSQATVILYWFIYSEAAVKRHDSTSCSFQFSHE